MRVLIITGAYPPDKCGVGDYAFHLANELATRSDIEVGVLTSTLSGTFLDSSRVAVFRMMANWSIKNILLIRSIVLDYCPDIVHIQYPTARYRGKLPRYLPLVLRLMKVLVVQTWHEHFTECVLLGWQNLLGLDSLIYVRPDLPQKLPKWVKVWLGTTPLVYVPNASTIPILSLNKELALRIKHQFTEVRPIICFFGFANPNKGIELLFDIADSAKHHLVLICDLSQKQPYQANILKLANQASWAGNVTVTGFLSAQRVGEILAVADAVIFPFPGGAGVWNTSLKASEAAGALTIATTQDANLLGYHEKENIYFAGCDCISDMRKALNRYLGMRKPSITNDPWEKVVMTHDQLYRKLCKTK
jgi:glycosyltransferase involved in cell wall biosynthesis